MASVYDRTTTYTPARQAHPDERLSPSAETFSVVDRHSLFTGAFRTARDLRVEGTVEGEVACEGKMVIAHGARVKATITAREIEVAGELDGEVTCSGRFRITPTGNATGKVTATNLVIEEGARFNGDFNMMREGATPAAAPADRSDALARRRGPESEPPPAPENRMNGGEEAAPADAGA
jgi:cytoskeletal protein CcmA (bactofilin family)